MGYSTLMGNKRGGGGGRRPGGGGGGGEQAFFVRRLGTSDTLSPVYGGVRGARCVSKYRLMCSFFLIFTAETTDITDRKERNDAQGGAHFSHLGSHKTS